MLLLFIFSSILLSNIQSSCQSNEFIYSGFSNSNITLSGVSKIKKNGLLQLTNDTSRLMGHSFYPKPFKFKSFNNTVNSFSTSFAFIIVPEYPKLGGHGMAFTISPSTDFVKSALPSQYLGLLNASDVGNFTNHLFAVEFDTVQDFEFGDINDNHVGININSLQSNESAKAAYVDNDSVQQDLNLKSGKTIFVWIEYESATRLINVTISPFSVKPISPLISFQVDLSDIFRDEMYVGFSASTGLLASSHYVQGWSFKMNGDAEFLKANSLPSLPGIKKKHKAAVITVSVLAIAAAISLVLVTLYVVKKYKNRDIIEAWELEIGPHRYSYKELKLATRRFKDSELLGFGGFGKVYKGSLPNSKTEVAVKRISQESNQGLREFVSEIATIGRLRHRNLVQLLGWCRRNGDLLLVYDYMPNGSLDNFLFDPKAILNWQQRFNIIKGVASGLLYLHEGYEQIVIHRDIKASNVLLDGELNGRLGDFGLARLYDHGENPSTTRVVGTLGYLAPELPRTGRATTGSDVYAFGALLLEVVCGRRPIEPKASPEELVLVDWVWGKWTEGKVLEVVDPKMDGEFDVKEIVMVLKLGLMCSNNALAGRPSMRQVIRFLDGEIEVPDVLRPPNGYDIGKGSEGFEDYMNSFVSSTCDKTSFGSLTTSPVSLMCENRETR